MIGERGTGKELIAERLHHLSPRWAGPLVTMNCAALPENLIEAELFGHEAGSFTGAAKTRHGRFEEADGGTLFLDELATLSSPAQDRLLRAVEYGEITRIGASKPITVDVRIVAATNENLPALVDQGRFRADLLDRLSFEVVTLPPLRARTGDISLAGRAFRAAHGGRARMAQLAGFLAGGSGRARGLSVARQCARIAQRRRAGGLSPRGPRAGKSTRSSSTRFDSPWATPDAHRPRSQPAPDAESARCRRRSRSRRRPSPPVASTNDFRSAVADYERALLEDALGRNRFNQRATAVALGLSYDQLRHALKRHKLHDTAA